MDEGAVQRLGRSVIRAGVSLPFVLLYALAREEGRVVTRAGRTRGHGTILEVGGEAVVPTGGRSVFALSHVTVCVEPPGYATAVFGAIAMSLLLGALAYNLLPRPVRRASRRRAAP